MALVLMGLIGVTAVAVVMFGVAAIVDAHRRREEHQAFLRGTLRQAVYHTAAQPVGPHRRRGLIVQPLPLLARNSFRLLEDSGVYPAG